MKLSLKQQANKKINGNTCTVFEYALNSDMFDVAVVKITGRYPHERRVTNTACVELAYVCEGQGKIVINHVEQQLNIGDIVVIEAGEKYYWEGVMQLFISCRPAWNNEQHQIVD